MCNEMCTNDPLKLCIGFLYEFLDYHYYCKLLKSPGCTTTENSGIDLYGAPTKVYPSDTLNTCTHYWKHSADSVITSKCPTYSTRSACEADTNCYYRTENYSLAATQKGCSNYQEIIFK